MPDKVLCDEVARFFCDRLNVNVPSADTDLFETGILDSLTFVDLLFHLEQQFDVRVSVDELEPDSFRTVGRIAAFVAARSSLNRVSAA
jgi:D-alanine--poly(phosphoribitol) ligase subunit 2